MTTDIEAYTAGSLAVRADQAFWTEEQRAVLAQMGADSDVTNAELAAFLHVCQRRRLDPFTTARDLAAHGAAVVVADLNEERGKALADEIGAIFVKTDVSDEQQVQAAEPPAPGGDGVALVSRGDVGQERVVDDERGGESEVGDQEQRPAQQMAPVGDEPETDGNR